MKKLRAFFFISISCMSNLASASMPCDSSLSNHILKDKKLNKANKERLEERLSYYLENEDCYERLTPLAASVKIGNIDLVKYFVKLGANINVHKPSYLTEEYRNGMWSPIIIAIAHKENEIFNYLVSIGADSNYGPNNTHPIFFAIAYSNLAIVKYYIQNGISTNISYVNNKGEKENLMQFAIRKKKIEIFNFLNRQGIKP